MFYYGAYDDPATGAREEVAAMPLDAIDPALVGCLRVTELRRVPLDFAASLDWLLDPSKIAAGASGARPRNTPEIWKAHLEALAGYGVCQRFPRSSGPPPVATYFGLPKSCRTLARSIVNCSDISDPVRDQVGPVCLCPFPAILDALARAIREAPVGKAAIWLSDLRHYYHQMKITSLLICVRCGDTKYVWQVLPMGHTCSCRVAQCASWLLLAESGMPVPNGPHPPALLIFGRKQSRAGVVTVIYDNVIAAATVVEAQAAALSWGQAAKRYGAVLKYNQVYKGGSLNPAPEAAEKNPVCCGLVMSVQAGPRGNELLYKHAGPNCERWLATVSSLREHPPTLRCMARLVGILIWDAYISRTGPATVSACLGEVITIAKAVARMRFRCGAWSALYRDETHVAALVTRVVTVCATNTWRTRARRRDTLERKAYAASDASSTGWGFIIFDSAGEIVKVKAGRWKRAMPMFLCEALVYLFAAREAAEMFPQSMIRVAIDAQAVAYAAAKGFSGSPLLQRVLERVAYHIEQQGCDIDPLWVKGTLNLADIPSRDADCDIARLKAHEEFGTRLIGTLAVLLDRGEATGAPIGFNDQSPEDVIEELVREHEEELGLPGEALTEALDVE